MERIFRISRAGFALCAGFLLFATMHELHPVLSTSLSLLVTVLCWHFPSILLFVAATAIISWSAPTWGFADVAVCGGVIYGFIMLTQSIFSVWYFDRFYDSLADGSTAETNGVTYTKRLGYWSDGSVSLTDAELREKAKSTGTIKFHLYHVGIAGMKEKE